MAPGAGHRPHSMQTDKPFFISERYSSIAIESFLSAWLAVLFPLGKRGHLFQCVSLTTLPKNFLRDIICIYVSLSKSCVHCKKKNSLICSLMSQMSELHQRETKRLEEEAGRSHRHMQSQHEKSFGI